MKVVALMRWEWQAGDQEKYWQGWQWDGKPGADLDCTELAVGWKAREQIMTHSPHRPSPVLGATHTSSFAY